MNFSSMEPRASRCTICYTSPGGSADDAGQTWHQYYLADYLLGSFFASNLGISSGPTPSLRRHCFNEDNDLRLSVFLIAQNGEDKSHKYPWRGFEQIQVSKTIRTLQ